MAWRRAADFWGWWVGELACCVPAPVTKLLFGQGTVVSLLLDGEVLRVAGFGSLPLDAAAVPAALRARLAAADGLALVLPAASVLRRVIDVPSAAAREMGKAVPFLVERHTPFPQGQARAAWRVRDEDGSGRTRIELAVTAAAPLERVLGRLAALDARVSCIHVDGDDRLPRLDFSAASQPGGGGRWRRETWRIFAAATLVLLLAGPPLVAVAVHHRAAGLQAALAARGVRTQDVARLRGAVAGEAAIASVLAGRLAGPDPLRVLQDVSEALPDGAWLFGFDLTPGGVRIGGFSNDLPAAIARLQALPEVARLEFVSPVIHDARADRDRFDIVLHLKFFQNAD